MNVTIEAEIIRELMDNYDEHRERWVCRYGTDEGFDEWFTTQVYIRD